MKPSFEMTSNGLNELLISPAVHSTVWFVVGMTIGVMSWFFLGQ
ncbi:MAG: hypothetical protein ACRD9R_01670 [Pyrinomonadaceae bacterium]